MAIVTDDAPNDLVASHLDRIAPALGDDKVALA
jgi:hypothetical protein